ncbi:MAG: bifunctional hydroxymethylpyrimidine kinase/phosphomethylpyrimidine kinase [Nitrososphaerales archaeon]
MEDVARALTIAGSDSGGGAGIQADLKTFAALGVYGMCVITAVTAQNTTGVSAVQPIDDEVVREQIRVVVSDIGVDAVKTGMLYSRGIIEVVADELENIKAPLVVDPVMVAKSGARLLKEDAEEALIKKILPLATVVTPNLDEAARLAGLSIKSLEDAEEAAKKIATLGPKAVVVKGGHLDLEESVDTLYYNGVVRKYASKRVSGGTHGTGCTFASAIAALLAKGYDIFSAVEEAKRFVADAILHSPKVGRGVAPVSPLGKTVLYAEKMKVLESVGEAVNLLENNSAFADLIPECQTNIAMALPQPKKLEDIAAIPGRIVNAMGKVKASGCPKFGASRHLASTLLAISEYTPLVRAALNIRFDERILDAARKLGYLCSEYDRSKEPPEVKAAEGETTKWGAREAVKSIGAVPDIIFHRGDVGKEAMIVILGRDAVEAVHKALKILTQYKHLKECSKS